MPTDRERTSITKSILGIAVLAAIASAGPVITSARAGADETPAPSRNSPDEPVAKSLSFQKAARFLDAVSQNWTETRQCGTCHTNYAYLIARPSLREVDSAAISEIRAFFEDRIENWDGPEKSDKPRWDTEVVATASALALNDAATTGKLHPLTRKALDRMWGLQKPDGSWDWLKCNWPPYEHDDYYGVAFAALGVGAAPDGYATSDTAKAGLERLRSYLKTTPPPDLHHKTILLWASTKLDGLMDSAARS
ncbi:squalene--hopene cyclase, partial [Singulisphaera rosea]